MTTPSTDRIRSLYANATAWDMGEREGRRDLQNFRDTQYAEFDAWLADHDAAIRVEERANPRDEHHTMAELYEYRMLYNAHAANLWARHGTHFVAKSWRHSDGEECFGGGWFVVVAHVGDGQVSNHYEAKHWDLFQVPEMDRAPEWDGHTPADAAQRLRAALTTTEATR